METLIFIFITSSVLMAVLVKFILEPKARNARALGDEKKAQLYEQLGFAIAILGGLALWIAIALLKDIG